MSLEEKLQARLLDEVEKYNAVLSSEQEGERQLQAIREQRVQAFGRVQAVQDLLQEALAEASVDAGQNGHGNGAAPAGRAGRRRPAKSD